MTRSRPNLKLMETTMTTSELPATMPIIVVSNDRRIAWQTDLNEALADIDLIDMQIESANRVYQLTADAAHDVADAIAKRAKDHADAMCLVAAKVRDATIEGLNRRRADLDLVAAGNRAALGASE